MKIWNVKAKKKEKFSLKRHTNPLTYILEIFEIINCQVVVAPELLLLRSEFGVVRTALINDGDLQFSFDLGVISSERNFPKNDFEYYGKNTTKVDTISSSIADRYYGTLRFNLAHYFSYSDDEIKLKMLVKNENFLIAADAFYKSPFYYAK